MQDEADYIYFNLRIDNIYDNVPEATGVPDPAYQRAAAKRANTLLKTGEILHRQSDYKFAIDFFNIRPNMPLLFFEILEGLNDDPNAGVYGICLTHTGSGDNYPERIMFTPDQTAGSIAVSGGTPRAPIDNNGLQDFETNPYYYANWSFANMVRMINTAYYDSWAAMVAAHPADSPSCPPYLVYDEPSGRICMILHQEYVRSPRAQIFHNVQMENFVEAIRVEQQTEYLTGDPDNFKELRIVPDLARPYESGAAAFGLPAMTDIVNPPVAGDVPYLPWKDVGNTEFYVLMQEYDAAYFWNNIRSVVFFSSSISVRNQYLPLSINPNKIQSTRVASLSIASPSVCTTERSHGLQNGDTVYIYAGNYSISGVPVPANSVRQFIAQNVTSNTLQLFNTNGTPLNVTAYAAAPQMWIYKKISANVGQFNSPTRSILSYFDIITQGGVDWRQNLYNSPAYRKWIDLTDNTALTGVDIDIYLELTNGTLIPLTLSIGNSIDIKFVFKRKDVIEGL